MKLKQKISPFLLIAFLALLITGCSASYYNPNPFHTPLFEKQNQLSASGYYGTSGFSLNTAYSFTDFLGVVAGGSYLSNDTFKSRGHRFGEIGLTYFLAFEDYITIPQFISFNKLEFIGGAGRGETFGTVSNVASPSPMQMTGYFNRYFLQLNLASSTAQSVTRKTSPNSSSFFVDFGLAVRYSYLQFYEFQGPLITFSTDLNDNVFELLTFIKLGFRYVKIEGQISRILDASGSVPLPANSFSIGASFLLDF
jgi:hypothetical protein